MTQDKTTIRPEAVVGAAAVMRLRAAGFDIIPRPQRRWVPTRFTCLMCGYSSLGGPGLDAFADWGFVWHRACVTPYQTAPSKRHDVKPMKLEWERDRDAA